MLYFVPGTQSLHQVKHVSQSSSPASIQGRGGNAPPALVVLGDVPFKGVVDNHNGGIFAGFPFNSEVLPSSYVLEGKVLALLFCVPLGLRTFDVRIFYGSKSKRTNLLVVTVVVLVSNDWADRSHEHHGHWTRRRRREGTGGE